MLKFFSSISETKRRRFKPLDNVRRFFRRRSSRTISPATASGSNMSRSSRLSNSFKIIGSRSRSTSELAASEYRSSHITGGPVPTTSSGGLSASHESIFGIEPTSDPIIQPTPIDEQSTAKSLRLHQLELKSVLTKRRSTEADDEDLGLPRSPATASLSTAEVLASDFKMQTNAIHNTGSDASLLSMDSCGTEEEALPVLNHSNKAIPSKIVYRPTINQDNGTNEEVRDLIEISNAVWPLSHSAAHHKIAVRPKKNHGPQRPKLSKQVQSGLPVTSEFDEGLFSINTSKTSENNITTSPERKAPQQVSLTPPHITEVKQRSLSLSRTENLTVCNDSTASTSSPVKVARSKSSVDKKLQQEIAHFWRRSKEKKKKDVPQEDNAPVPAERRKDLRKIKRDKEEKRKCSDASSNSQDSHHQQPLLSRLFGSRRSGRKKKEEVPINQIATPAPFIIAGNVDSTRIVEKSPSFQTAVPSNLGIEDKGYESMVVSAETIIRNDSGKSTKEDKSNTHKDQHIDREIEAVGESDFKSPFSRSSPPKFSAPQHQQRVAIERARKSIDGQMDSNMAHQEVMEPVNEIGNKKEILPRSPEISKKNDFSNKLNKPSQHLQTIIPMAGLSSFQRRVAGQGDEFSINDDELDYLPDTKSGIEGDYYSQLISCDTEENDSSFPVDINKDFILTKPESCLSAENIRRSLGKLRDSSEGLKKAINSLHCPSQSSDQLALSDAGSTSTGFTSTLDISDTEVSPMCSLDSKQSLDSDIEETDAVQGDVLIINDHKEISVNYEKPLPPARLSRDSGNPNHFVNGSPSQGNLLNKTDSFRAAFSKDDHISSGLTSGSSSSSMEHTNLAVRDVFETNIQPSMAENSNPITLNLHRQETIQQERLSTTYHQMPTDVSSKEVVGEANVDEDVFKTSDPASVNVTAKEMNNTDIKFRIVSQSFDSPKPYPIPSKKERIPLFSEPSIALSKSSPEVPEFMQIQLNKIEVTSPSSIVYSTAWETCKAPAPKETKQRKLSSNGVEHEVPTFSMSVRVQYPPPAAFPSYGRSISTPVEKNDQRPLVVHVKPGQCNSIEVITEASNTSISQKPYVSSVRMVPDDNETRKPKNEPINVSMVPTAVPLMTKFTAKPWSSKEDKEFRNKKVVGLEEKSIHIIETSTAENKDDPWKKIPTSGGDKKLNELSAENDNNVSKEVKLRRRKEANGNEETSELFKVFARRSVKMRDSLDLETELKLDIVSTTDVTPNATATVEKKSVSTPLIDNATSGNLTNHVVITNHRGTQATEEMAVEVIRQPASQTVVDRRMRFKRSSSIEDFTANDVTSGESPPEEADNIWRKMVTPRKLPLSRLSLNNQNQDSEAANKSTETTAQVPKVVVPRQSKVLDMVHNFQRLQVT